MNEIPAGTTVLVARVRPTGMAWDVEVHRVVLMDLLHRLEERQDYAEWNRLMRYVQTENGWVKNGVYLFWHKSNGLSGLLVIDQVPSGWFVSYASRRHHLKTPQVILRAFVLYLCGSRPSEELERLYSIGACRPRLTKDLGMPLWVPDEVVPDEKWSYEVARLDEEGVREKVTDHLLELTKVLTGAGAVAESRRQELGNFSFELGVRDTEEDWWIEVKLADDQSGTFPLWFFWHQPRKGKRESLVCSGIDPYRALEGYGIVARRSTREAKIEEWLSAAVVTSPVPEDAMVTYDLLGEQPFSWRTDEFLAWWEGVAK